MKQRQNWKRRMTSVILILALVLTMCIGSGGTAFGATTSKIQTAFEKTGDYIYKTVSAPAFGSIGGEWVMYGLAEAGYDMPDSYIKAYQKTVEEAVEAGKGVLHARKYTEYSRVIIAYAALGLDPTDISGYNMVEKLADFDAVVWQGINGTIFALRALDAGNYAIPEVSGIENVTTRQKLVNELLANQLDDGGWNLYYSPGEDEEANAQKKAILKSDVDLTAMALESLAPYYKQAKVKKAMEKAVACLSDMQQDDGGYNSWGTVNLESCAQVVSALSNIGINPNTDSRFKKNGKSVVDAMLTFYDEKTGGFRHVNTASGGYEPVVNQMATEQGYYALAQYFQAVPDKASVKSVTSPKKGALKVTWPAQTKADGYQIRIATNSGFTKSVKNVYVTAGTAKTKVKTITGLTKGKKYYVKVRAYQTICGKRVYGLYSTVKTVTVKK